MNDKFMKAYSLLNPEFFKELEKDNETMKDLIKGAKEQHAR